MASKRWDLCVSHKDKKSDKWRSSKVGVIFEGDKGQLQIRIDPGVAISTPEGVLLTGWLPKERDERGGRDSGGGGDSHSSSNGFDDNGDRLPF